MTALKDYPQLIFLAANVVNRKEWGLMRAKQALAVAENAADLKVAFGDFKNDNQRRAKRLELLQENQEYLDILDNVNDLTGAKADALAELERLRNEFSLAKLDRRLEIANKLVGLESAELAGV